MASTAFVPREYVLRMRISSTGRAQRASSPSERVSGLTCPSRTLAVAPARSAVAQAQRRGRPSSKATAEDSKRDSDSDEKCEVSWQGPAACASTAQQLCISQASVSPEGKGV
eukprot:jgi/Ulvmu1/11045/UM007_0227.1